MPFAQRNRNLLDGCTAPGPVAKRQQMVCASSSTSQMDCASAWRALFTSSKMRPIKGFQIQRFLQNFADLVKHLLAFGGKALNFVEADVLGGKGGVT